MVSRISHALFRIAITLVAAVVLTIIALGARLVFAPIQLTWLAPYLERALAPSHQQIRFEIQNAGVRLGKRRAIELVGAGVQAKGADGEVLIDLPEIQIGISPRALLRHGMLAPATLEAKAPLLILTRTQAGAIGLSGSQTTAEPEAPQGQIDLNGLLAPLLSGDPSQPLSYLEQVNISGGQLILKDQITDHTLMARDAGLTIRRLPESVAADVAFTLDQAAGPAKVRSTITRDAATGRVRFALNFEGLSPAELAKLDPKVSLDGVGLAVAGRLTADLDREQGLSPIAFDLQAENGVIERPDWLAAPLPIDSVSLRGRLAANLLGAEITESKIVAKGATIESQAQLVWADRKITLRAKVTAANVAAPDLELYWPPKAGREARDWVIANITDGVVPSAEVTIALKPGDFDRYPFPEEAVRGRFAFENLTVRYFETMPQLTGVAGSATFTARRMDFAVTGGQVGAIRLNDGSVVITGIGIKGRDTTHVVVKAAIDGPLDQAFALLDHQPLGFATKLGIRPAEASGQARTDLTLTLPLHRDFEASELRVQASTQLRDAGIRGLPGQLNLSDGNFTLKVDDTSADLSGHGALNQIPLAIEWQESFADQPKVKRRFRVHGMLDVQDLGRLGLKMPLPATGSSEVDATIAETAAGREAKLSLDLGPLAIDVPALGWQKPKDQPGRLAATILMRPGGPVQVEAFELTSTGVDIAGSLQMSLEPDRLERLLLSRFRAGRNEGTLDLRSQANRGYQVSVRAQSLDLVPLLEGEVTTGREAGEAVAPTPLQLTLAAKQVLFGATGLSDVDLDLVRDAQGWRTGTGQGRLPKGGKVELSLKSADAQRQLKITSNDAGHLLRVIDQTTSINGGKLELRAAIRRQVPALQAEGRFRIKDFTLLNAPLLARLLTVASLTGVGNLLGGKGIHFDRVDLPFTLRPDLITIDKGRISGSQIGLTVRGRIDREHDQLDLGGTIVPIYGLNWALSKLPLVGPFMAGREGEGAFAVTYAVKGPQTDPKISVNPLSVLAPGFIRDLFSGNANDPSEPARAVSAK